MTKLAIAFPILLAVLWAMRAKNRARWWAMPLRTRLIFAGITVGWVVLGGFLYASQVP